MDPPLELSNVLWKMVMNTVMTTSFLSGVPLRVVGLFFGFSFWASKLFVLFFF